MKKVIDHVFSLNDERIYDLKVETEFIYNYYENNETVNRDDIITVSDFSPYKKRFIRVNVLNHNQLDRENYNKDNFVEEVYRLSNINLDENRINYFNRIDQLSPTRKFTIARIDEVEKMSSIQYYNLDKLSIYHDQADFSQRMSYIRPEEFEAGVEKVYLNSIFSESDLYTNDNIYDSLIFANQNKQESIVDISFDLGGSVFSGLNKLTSKVNEVEDVGIDFSKYNAIRCGMLIEKFLLEDESYKFMSARFFTNTPDSEELNLPASFEDESVKYGKTYRYVVSNVYLYVQTDINDRCVLNYYLICDHPYITRDTECVEKEPPPPPNNLRFHFVNDSLKIMWDEPTDYQYDAKGYQILKRHSVEEPFQVIAQLEGHSENDLYVPEETTIGSSIIRTPDDVRYNFIDNEYEKGKITIYTIRTIDAHGLFSNYSEQIAILYDPFENKIIHDLLSYSGASRNMPNEKLVESSKFFEYKNNFIDNLPMLKNIKNIKFYLTPDFQKVKAGVKEFNIMNSDETYQFTIFRVNDLKKYSKQFKITNFI